MKRKRVGKYLVFLNEELGKGSFSTVYRGVQQETNLPVAVKLVNRQQILQDEYTKIAFFTEIQIMKHLKSKYVIELLDVQETKNNYYIVEELANEGTLRKIMKEQKGFSESDALKMFVQLLNGFGELVKNGIIHRDVKPQNILVKDNTLKIADFGFARQSDNNSFLSTIVGTPLYMAPQILKSEKYTYKCDIWSLGILLYQLIVGKGPWPITSENMLQNIIKGGNISFPQNVEISDKTKNFVMGCLAFEQENRFDWSQVYMHPLFVQKFKQNFQGVNESSIKVAFIISSLRMRVHSHNIDIGKLIQKRMPKYLTSQDFMVMIGLIDPQIPTNQVQMIYKNCQQRSQTMDTLSREEIKSYFRKMGFRVKMINLIDINKDHQPMEDEEQEEQKALFLLLARLQIRMHEKELDVYQIYRSEDKFKKNALTTKQFTQLVLKIDQSLNPHQIAMLFSEFDLNKDGSISFEEFYRSICKIAGVVNFIDQDSQKKLSRD